jgi:hypothetical protein
VSGQPLSFLLLAWFLPALVMSLANPLSRKPLKILLQFTLLYWLRFHIAGYSIARELQERLSR